MNIVVVLLLLLLIVIVIIIRLHRTTMYVEPRLPRPIVTDRVAWSVGLSVTLVSPTKMAEPIKMPFGLWVGWAVGIMS